MYWKYKLHHTNIFLHFNSIPTCWCITREQITFLYGSNSYIIRNGFSFLLNPMDFCVVLKRCSPAADNGTKSDVDALLRPVSVPDSVRISMGNLFLLCIMFFLSMLYHRRALLAYRAYKVFTVFTPCHWI